jgi:hypothetical protein
MHQSIDKFSTACRNFGLTIGTKNTEVVHQAVPGKLNTKPGIRVIWEELKTIDRFTYLGSTLSSVVNVDKASPSFGLFFHTVWERREIFTETNLKVYRAAVLTTLLSWTVYSRHARRLNHFHTSCYTGSSAYDGDTRYRIPRCCKKLIFHLFTPFSKIAMCTGLDI